MKINYFYILVFGANVVVCLPQLNLYKSSSNVTDENGDKSTEYENNLSYDKLGDKDESTKETEVRENSTQIVKIDGNVGKDVLTINEDMYTNQRLIPIYHRQAEHAVPIRWLPLPPRYMIPILPRTSEQIITATYDSPFKKEVSEPKFIAETDIDESVKQPATVVPPQIAYTPGPDETRFSTPYLASVPVDPDLYNSRETSIPKKPLPSPFVQHRYFSMDGPQPYYRYPVHALPKYNPVNVFPPPFNDGTILFQEPLPLTTAEESITGDLQEQGPGEIVKDNNAGNKHQLIVEYTNGTNLNADISEHLTDFVRNLDDSAKTDNDRDYTNQNSKQDNNFDSSDIDTTKISSYVNPDATYDFNFDDGHAMYYPPNIRKRHPQVIYSSYQNPEPKEKPEYSMKYSDYSDSIHNGDHLTHEPDILYGRNHQDVYNSNKKLNIGNSFEISHAQKIEEILLDKTNITYNNSHINQDFANWSKNATIIEREDQKQQFDYVDNTKQHEKLDMLINNVRKEDIDSNNPNSNDKIKSKEITSDTHNMDDTENVSKVPFGIDSEKEKNQKSLNVTNKKEDEMISTDIRIFDSFENKEKNKSTMGSQSIGSKDHKDLSKTPPTKTITKVNDVDNKTTIADIHKEDVKIERTMQLQSDYDIKKNNYDQDTDTPQIEAPLNDSEKFLLNNDDKSIVGINTATENANIQTTKKGNSLIARNEINSNQTKETTTFKIIESNRDLQPTESREKKIDNEDQENFEDGVQNNTSKDVTKYNIEKNINQALNGPASLHKLKHENSTGNYGKEEDKKINTENDREDNIEYESPLSETTTDNSKREQSNEKYVKPNLETPENFGNSKVKRIDTESSMDQDINKNPVEQKEANVAEAIDINFTKKEVAKFKEQDGNDHDSENRSEVIPLNNKQVEAVTTASKEPTTPDQDTLVSSDTDSSEENDDAFNDFDDDFDEISSALKTSTEESIKSKLGFTTTCIRHPVNISMNDDMSSKNTAEPMRLQFYSKLFEDYNKKHSVIPLTVIQKDIRSYVYKNGTIVDVIIEVVWDVKNDGKPVQISTRKTIKQRKKKISQRN